MRGHQLVRQPRIIQAIEASPNRRHHAKAQRAPGEIFKILFPPFKIFSLLQHSRTILCVLGALAKDKMSRKAAKFAKKSVLHLPPLDIYLVQSLGRVSQPGKRTFAFFAPLREPKWSALGALARNLGMRLSRYEDFQSI